MIEVLLSRRLALRPSQQGWDILDKADWSVVGQADGGRDGPLARLEIQTDRRGDGLGREAFLRLAAHAPGFIPEILTADAGPGAWLDSLGYRLDGDCRRWSDPGPLRDPAEPAGARACAELGISDPGRLPRFDEPTRVVDCGPDHFGRPLYLAPEAAGPWQAMREAGAADGVVLDPVSGYRSVAYQAALVRRKLEAGQLLEDILRVSAAPGHSEHHTGRALDLTTTDSPVLETAFERTPAFAWLSERAGAFGFTLSFPQGNRWGMHYEPWHWAFQD